MKKLVLFRHGESTWNKENRFTGWTDVPLNEKGVQEALDAGRVLKQEGYTFDEAYTSVLKRAIKTLWIVLEEMDLMWIPVHRTLQSSAPQRDNVFPGQRLSGLAESPPS